MKSEEFRTDPLFLRNQCSGAGDYEMPVIRREEVALENIQFIGYDNLNRKETTKIVHFFLDDYKFEPVWNKPDSKIEVLKEYRAVLSPQFSIYTEMPMPLQIYNTFRSRWCGAYFQKKGVKVIPTVSWGKPETFQFCFDGVEEGSVVAVSTLGVRTEKALFLQGYSEMLKRLRPEAVICYGKPFEEMGGRIVEIDYAETNCLPSEKGMGSAFGKNSLPPNDSQLKHLFRNKEGHLQDTSENRALLLRVANDPKNYLGTDVKGARWYAEIQRDGSQVWARVWNETIFNGGANLPPRPWDPTTGLNQPKKQEENSMRISYDRAFLATYYVLDDMYQKTPSDSLAVIASDMDPFIFADGKSADPASYEDFVDCCKEVEKQESYGEEIFLAYRCGLAYMQFFNDSWGYPLEEEMKRFSFEDFKKSYEKAAQTSI